MVTLTIIIPVYKVEKYIDGTLSSIYNQNADEDVFEVIVVNDGTPDNSMFIVKKYEQAHHNLTIVNQQNQGLSIARNEGLKRAKGKYVWFVDSDDTIGDTSLRDFFELSRTNQDIDFFCFDIKEVKELNQEVKISSVFNKVDYHKYYLKIFNGKFYCNKLPTGIVQRFIFSRDFLIKNNIAFIPGIIHEDLDFLIRCYIFGGRILPVNIVVYNYLIREKDSIMTSLGLKSFTDRLIILDDLLQHKAKESKSASLIDYHLFEIVYNMLFALNKDAARFNSFKKNNKLYLKKLGLHSFFSSLNYFSIGRFFRFLKLLFY